ncbi:MFS transporter [Streptomyces sp. NBC_01180]|uniref:MFS transporter n=1 Tax=Streptomyces sp. NBC_01180 TaxID=2903763 RepID=UPI0038660291|nr:MFS transporter [Streptomyces sp. NBC_01180]
MSSTITSGQRFVLASVCAVAVSTIYAIQPVLEAAGSDLGLAGSTLGWLVAVGQLGYFAGLVLLVPLGDVLNRRTLIVGHLMLTGAGATITSLAPSGVVAGVGLAVAGLFAVVVQITVAYVAATSPEGERGRNIGTVTSGVVLGILAVRVLAGVLGESVGWRAVYAVLAVLCIALALVAQVALYSDARPARARYRDALATAGRLVVTDRLFLSRGLIAFFLFASFGTLWSGLALPLGAAPWHFGTTAVGLFGLAGLVGAVAASRAGAWADAGRARAVTGWSLALLAASWALTTRTTPTLWLLITGVVLLDFAVQAVHVSNQHLLTAAHPERSSSVIGAYMAFYSLGSALGATTTTWAYTAAGWWASCLLGAAYAVAALAVWTLARRATASLLVGPVPEPPSPPPPPPASASASASQKLA